MSLSDSDRISNLWKASRGVTDVFKEGTYVASQQTPFNENVLNKTPFGNGEYNIEVL